MNTFEMNDQQVAGLAAAICATAEAMGQEMNPGTAAMIAEDLCAYSVPTVKAALKACRFEVKGKLAMADILQRVQAADGRPGKDEAWAIAMTTNDEFETVVLTDEIQLALAAAKPVLDAGDKVGARMAFISAYERLVTRARSDAAPPSWSVSLGHDPVRRITAIESAVRMQLISQQAGDQHLTDLRVSAVSADGQAIAGLLTGRVVEASPRVREKLAEVRSIIEGNQKQQARQRLKKAQAARVDIYLRRRRFRAQVAALQGKETSR
jgi:hypothetical protein